MIEIKISYFVYNKENNKICATQYLTLNEEQILEFAKQKVEEDNKGSYFIDYCEIKDFEIIETTIK